MQAERKFDRQVKILTIAHRLQDRGATNLTLSQRHKEIAFRPGLDILNMNMCTRGHRNQRVLRRVNLTRAMRNRIPSIVVQSDVRRPNALYQIQAILGQIKKVIFAVFPDSPGQ